MVKRRFRGERKRILTPSHSQGEGGMWRRKKEGNVVKHPPIHILRYRGLPFKGGMWRWKIERNLPLSHTPLSRTSSKGGM